MSQEDPQLPPENPILPGESELGDDLTSNVAGDFPGAFTGDVLWWKPGFAETARLMGWRWLWLLPVVGFFALLALVPRDGAVIQFLWFGGIKFIVMALSLPFILAGHAFAKAVKLRTEPFCIHCGYGLSGLPDHHRCPECGRPYTFAAIEEYRRDPQWFIQRWKQRHEMPRREQPFVAGLKRRKSRDGT